MEKYNPKVVCFSCKFGWGYLSGWKTPDGIKNWIPIAGSGKIDAVHIMSALKKGADGVLILTCPSGQCHFGDGNLRTETRVRLIRKVLEAYGIEPQRVRVEFARDPEGKKISQFVNSMKADLTGLGPIRIGPDVSLTEHVAP